MENYRKIFICNNRVKKISSEPDAVIERVTSGPRAIGSIVTQCHNMDEFIGVYYCFISKSDAIMQTDLCIADLEMLFTTLGIFANHSASLVTAHIALDEKLMT